jgi:hypothetical protein
VKTALLAFLSGFVVTAVAQTLQPVVAADGGTNWTLIAIGVLIAVAVVGFIYLKREDPAALTSVTTTANADLASVRAELTKLSAAITQHTVAVTAATPGAVVPPVVVGKNGVAGTFTIEVTGTPATDMAAINAKYFG